MSPHLTLFQLLCNYPETLIYVFWKIHLIKFHLDLLILAREINYFFRLRKFAGNLTEFFLN